MVLVSVYLQLFCISGLIYCLVCLYVVDLFTLKLRLVPLTVRSFDLVYVTERHAVLREALCV